MVDAQLSLLRDSPIICPIPRCSTEWLLSLGTCGMGIWIALNPDGAQLHAYFVSIPGSVAWHLILPFVWSTVLFFAGLFQIVTLLTPYRRPQHWASIACFLAWGVDGVGFWNAGLVLLLWPTCVFLFGEFFVALFIRAARV